MELNSIEANTIHLQLKQKLLKILDMTRKQTTNPINIRTWQ